MVRKAFLLVLSAAISAPVLAGNPTVPAQSTSKPDPENKIVCKFINTTGSRLRRDRECRTRAEWERAPEATRDDVERQEQRATGDPSNPPH